MNTTRVATSRAKPISWVTTIIVMPAFGELLHDVEDASDELGVERRGDLVEEHHVRVHRQRTGDRHALLLTAGELRREVVGSIGQADPGQLLLSDALGLGLGAPQHLALGDHDVAQAR